MTIWLNNTWIIYYLSYIGMCIERVIYSSWENEIVARESGMKGERGRPVHGNLHFRAERRN